MDPTQQPQNNQSAQTIERGLDAIARAIQQRVVGVMVRLGLNTWNGSSVLGTTWNDYATVIATSNGGVVDLDWSAVVFNGNSGANRTFDVRVVCDGVAVDTVSGLWATFVSPSSPPYTFSFIFSHQPASGSHTWKLQIQASAGSAVLTTKSVLRVIEAR